MKIKFKENALQVCCIIFGLLGVSGVMIYYLLSKLSKYIDLGYLSFVNKFTFQIVSALVILNIIFLILLFMKNRKFKTNRLKLKHFLFSVLPIAIGSYLILCLFYSVVEDNLVVKNNLIFQPSSISTTNSQENVEEISLTTSDNIKLQGWLVKNSVKAKAPLIIYFAGSGQEVSKMVDYAEKLDGYSVAFFNYRGFGLSEGSPSQDNCFNDAKLIYDTLSKRKDIDSQRIISMGWSLGTCSAVYLSDNRTVISTILVAPPSSMANLLQPYVPVIPLSIVMKQSFNSLSRAPNINTPLLCLIGSDDITASASMDLVKKWKGKSTVKRYEGFDHFLLFENNNSLLDIQNFLKSLE